MKAVKLNHECIDCLLKKHLNAYPCSADKSEITEYKKRILGIISSAGKTESAPEILEKIINLKKEMFNFAEDFSKEKVHFNELMLAQEESLQTKINSASDPVYQAMLYAMIGNYIDFGAMENVSEDYLSDAFENTDFPHTDFSEYQNLRQDIKNAKKLVYITDNCGEIVADKLFISAIREFNPNLEICAIVRGGDVLNDATMDDALQVGIDKVCRVIGSGMAVAGTCPHRMPPDAREAIESSDVIIPKGHANFESLSFYGKNIYFIFLCKCDMFARRFNVPVLTGMLLNDLRMKF